MKKESLRIILIGLLVAAMVTATSFAEPADNAQSPENGLTVETLRKEALAILDARCNICHRMQNPFMVFKDKNISKRAERIYRAVFVERRMPKGDVIRLTPEELTTLKKWLFTEIK